MKKIIFSTLLFLIILDKNTLAQQPCNENKIVISSGGFADNRAIVTVGESVIYNDSGHSLQLGYHSVQPYSNCRTASNNEQLISPAVPSEISLFPNPATNEIKIININDEEIYHYRMFDYAGNLVMENNINPVSNEFNLDVSKLKASYYMLVLTSDSGNYNQIFKFNKVY